MNTTSHDDLIYSLAFSYSKIIGPRTFDKLLKKFGNPTAAYHASTKYLEKIIGLNKTKKFEKFREVYKADSTLFALNKKNIQILLPRSSEWNNYFSYIHDLPIVIYSIGDISLLKNVNTITLSIIGTRSPSPYGKSLTEQLTSEFVQHNITILSGLALGIDSIAHRTCIEAKGKTIAILGSGIDMPYPSHHRSLYNKIVDSEGLIISEYPPGTLPFPGNFVQRNRLISGLSDGLIVIEGSKNSGTLITGKYANEQGKNVFAVPGPITSKLSYAPHQLINDGATLINRAKDVLDHYGIYKKTNTQDTMYDSNFTKIEDQILNEINTQAQSSNNLFEVLQTRVKISFPDLLSSISTLEIKGMIQKARNGKYYSKMKTNSNPTPSIPP